MVSPYEEHGARVEAHYNLYEWAALSPPERALEVAHLRLRQAVHQHQEAVIARYVRRKSRARR